MLKQTTIAASSQSAGHTTCLSQRFHQSWRAALPAALLILAAVPGGADERESSAPSAKDGPALSTERDDAHPATLAQPPPFSAVEPAALASLPQGMPARVLILYLRSNAQARARAESLAKTLRQSDIEVADIRESAGVNRTELRVFYKPDFAMAQRIDGLTGIVPIRVGVTENGLMVRPGLLQLSIVPQ